MDCWLEEARGRRMHGRWGRWLPIAFLGYSEDIARRNLADSTDATQYRAVRYVRSLPKKRKASR